VSEQGYLAGQAAQLNSSPKIWSLDCLWFVFGHI